MTSMPASRNARAMTLAPRSWPSSPGLATSTRILRSAGIRVDSTKRRFHRRDTDKSVLSEIPSAARDPYRYDDFVVLCLQLAYLSFPAVLRTYSDPSLRSGFQRRSSSALLRLRSRFAVSRGHGKLQASPQVPAGVAAIRMP